MKINIGDIYREQQSNYNFVSEFSSGKILDITFGKYLDFKKSELLFSKKITEIWSLDLLNNDQYLTIRKLDSNKKIIFHKENIEKLKYIKFDSIFSFNLMQLTYDISSLLEIIRNCLSPNGTVIVSILNNNIYLNSNKDSLSIINFKQELNSYFSDVVLFSQGSSIQLAQYTKKVSSNIKSDLLVSKKSLIKHNIKKFFKLNNILQLFYLKNLSPLFQKYKNLRRKKKFKINPNKYDITPFDEKNSPVSILAVCKKII